MQFSLLIDWTDETELYSPTIRMVGTIVAVSLEFAIDSTLGEGSKKQRCERGYDDIRLWNHPKQLLLGIWSSSSRHIRSMARSQVLWLASAVSFPLTVSKYNWLTRCIRHKKHGRPHALGRVLPSIIKSFSPLPWVLIYSIQIDSEYEHSCQSRNQP